MKKTILLLTALAVVLLFFTLSGQTQSPPQGDRVEGKWHTVASGDNLWKLAVKYYGDGNRYLWIWAANPKLLSSERIRVYYRWIYVDLVRGEPIFIPDQRPDIPTLLKQRATLIREKNEQVANLQVEVKKNVEMGGQVQGLQRQIRSLTIDLGRVYWLILILLVLLLASVTFLFFYGRRRGDTVVVETTRTRRVAPPPI